MNESASGYWVIALTLLCAAVLAVFPLDRSLVWWRPEWVLLVLVYWTIALPHRIGMLTALLAGFLADVLEGVAIGQNMLSFTIIVVLARLMYQRVRVFSPLQQAWVVFVLVGVHQLIGQWLQSLQGMGALGFVFLLPALSSACFWPLVMPVLRALRRGFQVS